MIERIGVCAVTALFACAMALACIALPSLPAMAAETQTGSVQIVYEVVDDGARTVSVPKRAASADAEPSGASAAASRIASAVKTGDLLQSWQLYALACEAILVLAVAVLARGRRAEGEER